MDHAVRELNRIYNQKGLELALALGEFVLDNFFDGSVEAFRSGNRTHRTFRALARRSDLMVSHTTLWTAVNIVEQMQILPERIARQLSYSHHRALLTVKASGDKTRLARLAVQDGLTTRQLDALVRDWASRQQTTRTGRPRIPTLVKSIRQVDSAMQKALSSGVDESWVASRSPDELRALLGRVEQSIEALGDVAALLERYSPPASDDDAAE